MARRFNIEVFVDADGVVKATAKGKTAFERLGKGAGDADRRIGLLNRRIGEINKFAVLAGVAMAGMFTRSILEATDRQAKAVALLENGIRKAGDALGLSSKQIQQWAGDLQIATGIGDEEILEFMSVLLSFRRITGDTFKDTSRLVLDVATVMQQDFKSAAVQLGKALDDPARNLAQLSRSGITFTEQQRDQVKALQESGHLLEAQALILEELRKQYGGAAEAARDTLGGALKALRGEWGDLQEKLGEEAEGGTLRTAVEAWIRWIRAAKENMSTLSAAWNQTLADIVGALASLVENASEFLQNPFIRLLLFGEQKAIEGLDSVSETLRTLQEGLEIKADEDLERAAEGLRHIATAASGAAAAAGNFAPAVEDGVAKAVEAVRRSPFMAPDRIGLLWFPPGTAQEILRRAEAAHKEAVGAVRKSPFMAPDRIGMLWFPPGTIDEIQRNLAELSTAAEVPGFTEKSVSFGGEVVDLLHAAADAADQMGEGFGDTLDRVASLASAVVSLLTAVSALAAMYHSVTAAELGAAEAATTLQIAMGWIGVIGAAVAALAAAFGLIGGGSSGPTGLDKALERLSDFFGSVLPREVEAIVERFGEIKLAIADAARTGQDMAEAIEAANRAIKQLRDDLLGLTRDFADQLNAALAFNTQALQTLQGQVGEGNLGGGFGPGAAAAADLVNAAVEGLNVKLIDLAKFAERLAMEFAGVSFEFLSVHSEAKALRGAIKGLGLDADETARLLGLVTQAEKIRMAEIENDVLQRLVNVLKQIPALQGEAAKLQQKINQAKFQIEVKLIQMQLKALGLMTKAFKHMLKIAQQFGEELANFKVPDINVGTVEVGGGGGVGGGRGGAGSGRRQQRRQARQSLLDELERFFDAGRIQTFAQRMRDLREQFFGPGGFMERARELGVSAKKVTAAFAEAVRQLREEAMQGIRDLLAELRGGELSGMDLQSRFFMAQQEFNRLLAAARSGNLDAAAQLPEAARNLLDLARQLFGSGDRFQQIFQQVTGGLESVLSQGEAAMSREQQQAEMLRNAIGDQTAALVDIGSAQERRLRAIEQRSEQQTSLLSEIYDEMRRQGAA